LDTIGDSLKDSWKL